MNNIVLDTMVKGYRYIESNGNPIVAFNETECFFTPNYHCHYRSNDIVLPIYAERALDRLKQESIQVKYEKKIVTKDLEILFFQGTKGYAMLCFFTDKSIPFIVSFKASVKDLTEEHFKKGREFKDEVFVEIALSWIDAVKERVSEFEKRLENRKNGGKEDNIELSCRANDDFDMSCFVCNSSLVGEYDTDGDEYVDCPYCGARYCITANAEVNIRIKHIGNKDSE